MRRPDPNFLNLLLKDKTVTKKHMFLVNPSVAVCVIEFQESSMQALCKASTCLKTVQRDFSAKSNKAECAIKQPVKEVIGTKHIEHRPNFAHNSILHACMHFLFQFLLFSFQF